MIKARGQGSLEYLLLIAGAVLVAIIVFLLLFTFAPVGGDVLNTNVEEYKKIDLCTGQGAACNFFLNWNEGFQDDPKGFILENKSSWRTLYLRGITVRFICGDEICPDNYSIDPATTLEFPVKNCTVGTNNIYSCDSCNVAIESCTTQTLPFCDPGTDGDCEFYANFPSFFPPFALTLKPLESIKVGVVPSFLPNEPELTGIQYIFKVAHLYNGALEDESDDVKAQSLFWYSSLPDQTGPLFSCVNNTPWEMGYGCEIAAGCKATTCGAAEAEDQFFSFCNNPDGSMKYLDGTVICLTNDVPSLPQCYNMSQNPGWLTISESEGTAFQIIPDSLKNVADYVSSIPKGLYVEVHDFTAPACQTDPLSATCQSFCQSSLIPINAYSLGQPAQSTQMCGVLGTPSAIQLASNLSPTVSLASWDAIANKARCVGIYEFSGTAMDVIETTAIGNKPFHIGVYAASGSMNIDTLYSTPSDASLAPPSIRALFYPK